MNTLVRPPVLASPTRLAITAIPIVGFLATPLLPFVNQPRLWLGVPSVLVWTALCVIGTVVALQVVEASYLRDGGVAADAAELAGAELAGAELAAEHAAERAAADEGVVR
ncbi:hypothetical protein [Nostocoides sp. HKS02]|uniref:hypothetical protein n=1 Tax=Nostocoides sp. HKS02 TaxID=1813880 RepID=UPI0012B46A47|nr:hypothetical protein [Tetrasphaera sp. HKS02]QGN57314.1 hypothetical protein GKE56_04870 [Tetrasphaera sp. HKS02]